MHTLELPMIGHLDEGGRNERAGSLEVHNVHIPAKRVRRSDPRHLLAPFHE